MNTPSMNRSIRSYSVEETDWPSRPTAVGAATEPPDVQPTLCVVLYDDDRHSYYDYVEVLMQELGYSEQVAYQLTQIIDAAGRAVVWTGPADEAEELARLVHNHRFEWRRSCSVTAPHHIDPHAPPLVISVEPAGWDHETTRSARPCFRMRGAWRWPLERVFDLETPVSAGEVNELRSGVAVENKSRGGRR